MEIASLNLLLIQPSLLKSGYAFVKVNEKVDPTPGVPLALTK
jgi:hypothetical protein